VESTIHPPTDSWLLWDTERVLIRQLKRSREFGVQFTDHTRRVKRRWRAIGNARRGEDRVPLYRDLVKMVEETLEDARRAVSTLTEIANEQAQQSRILLQHHVELGRRVLDQTGRRVFAGESVPSQEKIVSIFEPHTDILVKGRPQIDYGHKICLTTGTSSMVLDCMILNGNPADKNLTTEMIRRHRTIYDEVPSRAAFDGAFASRANVEELKAMGVDDVVFSKRCGLSINEMVTESWVYKRLRDFRAGIEGCISFLKRCFGLRRCTWKGFDSFKAYVWASILSANLLTFARHRLAAVP
jgi:IS5 family transposase